MSDYNNAIENKDRDALYQYWFGERPTYAEGEE